MHFNNTKYTYVLPFLIFLLLSACGGGGASSSAPSDVTPPAVSSTSPANNAAGVAVNAAITATFSENIDVATISAATFTLNNGVAGAVTYSGTTATFTPSSSLAHSTTYTATITTGIKDATGNAMATNYTWNFTTGPDTSALTADVTIIAGVTSGGAWSGGNPDIFTPNAPLATVSAAEIESHLNAGTAVTINTSAAVSGTGDIDISAPVAWNTGAVFTVSAYRNVNVNSDITATGNSAGLVLSPNNNGLGGGSYSLNNGSVITLSGTTPSLTIAGNAYTVINDVTALQNMSSFPAKKYALGSNIDATVTGTWSSGAGFVPVGDLTTPFTGVFDGLNHIITGLNINSLLVSYVGLFGVTNSTNVAIRNVGLVGVFISGNSFVGGLVGSNGGDINWATKSPGIITNCYVTGTIAGNAYAGGLVGYMFGNSLHGAIDKSYVTASVTSTNVSGPVYVGGLVGLNDGGTISNSYATGAVTGTGSINAGQFTGGLVGANVGTIANSYSTGAVLGSTYVGGLVGEDIGISITNSYSTGAVTGVNDVGGLAGYSSGAIVHSYATGAVTSGGGDLAVGGLVGYKNLGSTQNSYATGNVSGGMYVGGLLGYELGSLVENSYATGSVTGGNYVGGLAGYSSNGSWTNSYSAGCVTVPVGSGGYGGGLLGWGLGQVIISSYWDVQASCQATSVAGGAGLTTAQMKAQASFPGWDFTNIWMINEGVSYPTLRGF